MLFLFLLSFPGAFLISKSSDQQLSDFDFQGVPGLLLLQPEFCKLFSCRYVVFIICFLIHPCFPVFLCVCSVSKDLADKLHLSARASLTRSTIITMPKKVVPSSSRSTIQEGSEVLMLPTYIISSIKNHQLAFEWF